MADLHKYTIDENISRRNIVIHQLENELDRIVTSKREAMIYGLDYSYYEQRETEINKQLSELRK
jgi:hypothetical protein